MLIVAAVALLVAGLVVLAVAARKTRAYWPVTMLLVGSALLVTLQLRAANREAKGTDASLADSCRYLTTELDALVFDYQSVMIAKEKGAISPVDEVRVRDHYVKLVSSHRDWLQACVPDATSCLPADLNERTVDKIEHCTKRAD